MPKHDYDAVNRETVAVVDETGHGRSVTRDWLALPESTDEVLEAVASGRSLRRFASDRGLSYSMLQRHLTSDEVEPRYRVAQEQQAEHLLGEMERICTAIEDGMDPKAGAVILDTLKWRISKFNQRRFGERQVIEQHTYDHTKAHVEAVRALAKMQRPVIEGQVIRPLAPPERVRSE